MIALCLAVVLAGAGLGSATAANEIGFVEEFSLAEDRERTLEQLIPGTEAYYFYSGLTYQQQRRDDRFWDLMKAWTRQYGYTHQVNQLLNRQALLTYEETPHRTIEHIVRELNLRFDHQRSAADRPLDQPVLLDPNLISTPTLLQRALRSHQNLQGIEDAGLDALPFDQLNPVRRRDLLRRLERPDIPGLADLVIADLHSEASGDFGSLPVHPQLTLEQMDACALRMPGLLDQTRFIEAYLRKLAPSDDVDPRFDLSAHKAHLDRLWTFVQQLPPAQASLKAHVLYHWLAFERRQGRAPRDLFLQYLQLPRPMPYMRNEFVREAARRSGPVQLSERFNDATGLDPVVNDEDLVRAYLSRFLRDAENPREFEPYIRDTYLTDVLVETKLVHGIGDPEQWYALSTPRKIQALYDRVDLEFSVRNPEFFPADDPVSLDVWVKHIDTLMIKVYRLNPYNIYRTTEQEITTALDLDGLVATHAQVIEIPEPPIRRVRRTLALPSCDRPGVYVVDLIGNGVNSRALIRKGRLQHFIDIGPAGYEFRVLDEINRLRPEATIWLGGRVYPADEEGRIFIPFSSAPGSPSIVLRAGDRCSLSTFEHREAVYQLAARFHVDPESLLKGAQADLLVRPVLTLNRHPVSLALLEDVRLTLVSTDSAGATSRSDIPDFPLHEDRESVHTFPVPDNLRTLAFELFGQVRNLNTGETEDLRSTAALRVNAVDATLQVDDLHLRCEKGSFVLECRGKNGEPRAHQPVHLTLKHRFFRDPVHTTLQTDASGRIQLGVLDTIDSIQARAPDGANRQWTPAGDRFAYPYSLHRTNREPIRLPYVGSAEQPARLRYALLERRGPTYVHDRTDVIEVEDGHLVIPPLPAGEYDLELKEADHRVRLRVTDGENRGDYVVSSNRLLLLRRPSPLHIRRVDLGRDAVEVHLAQAGPFSRVHVLATHYWPAVDPYQALRVDTPEPYTVPLVQAKSQYVVGRNIGEEYRYILQRGRADIYPGNLLERPSLLLHPWAVRTTETAIVEAEAGEAFDAAPPPAEAEVRRTTGAAPPPIEAASIANYDFLAAPSVRLSNLRPDEQGVVRIERARLGRRPHLFVVAVDPRNTSYRSVTLPAETIPTRDLRLQAPLNPDLHFTEQKRVSRLETGEILRLHDVATSDIETYETVGEAFRLLSTLSDDPTLQEFSFVTQWARLSDTEKLERWSEYASHELHFFLFHKDRPFFDRWVKPALAYKKDKTFLDGWLLEQDLSAHLEPWAFGRLNAAERILLAERGPATRERMARDTEDRFELIPPDVDRYHRLFDIAMMGAALSEPDRYGIDQARQAKRRGEPGRLADQPTRPFMQAAPSPAMISEADALGGRDESMERELAAEDAAPGAHAHRKARAFHPPRAAARQRTRILFRQADTTKEYAENNYYRVPIEEQTADRVQVNAFWNDYAHRNPSAPFLSPNFPYATGNLTEMMLALSVLDLPFEAGDHAANIEQPGFRLEAGSPLIAFHREILEAAADDENAPVLVAQQFFNAMDRYGYDGHERFDKFVTGEFLARTPYGCQVVLTNPTSTRQNLAVLLQIPAGSLPLQDGFESRSLPVTLDPFGARTVEYYFYFPAAGEYRHYPVHVARNERHTAHGEPMRFPVVDRLSRIDRNSWDYVSQQGSEDDVLAYLRSHNLYRIDLERIAWRMKDQGFFRSVLTLLRERHVFHPILWSYGLHHADRQAMAEFLRASGFANRCGMAIESPLLTIDPVERHAYQHLEYKPLIHARAHSLGPTRTILNDRLHQQYHAFLAVLRDRPALDDHDRLGAVYYLFLQDRVPEALRMLSRVDPSQLHERMQYDYAKVYAQFYRGDVEAARSLAEAYVAAPDPQWRKRFAAARAQLDELTGHVAAVTDDQARDQVQDQLAETEPGFDVEVEGRQIRVTFQRVDQFDINYYPMDIELLFSRNPFMQQQSNHFTFIEPARTDTVQTPPGASHLTRDLPEPFHRRNVMVEIVAGGLRKARASYANQLSVALTENYGRLRVTRDRSGEPLPRTYVKVYARTSDGAVSFYKDGYTDLRGKFDYVSLSTAALDVVNRFALLILHPDYGALIREVDPPQR